MKKILSLFLVLFVSFMPFFSFANPIALPMSATFYEALILGATGAAAAGSISQMNEEEKKQLEVAMKISNPLVSMPILLTGVNSIHTAMANELGTMTPAQKREFMKAAVNQAFLSSGQPALAPALAPDASLETLTEAYNQVRDSVYIPFSFSSQYIDAVLSQIRNGAYDFPDNLTSGLVAVKIQSDSDDWSGTKRVVVYRLFFDNLSYDPTKTDQIYYPYVTTLYTRVYLKATGELIEEMQAVGGYWASLDDAFQYEHNSISADLKVRLDALKQSLSNSISNGAVIGLSLKFLEDGTFSTKDVVTFPTGTQPWAKQTSTGRFDLPFLPDLDNPVVGGPVPFPSNPSIPLPHTIPVPANPALNPAYPWVDDPKALPYDIPKNPAIPIPKNPAIPANPAIPDEATKVLPFFPDVTVPDFDFSPLFVPIPEKFPFCIPFDLVNAFTNFSNLTSDTEWQPIWHVPFLTEDIVVDITMFNPVAKVIRYFVFLIFVVGLIHSTRKLIRG